VQGALKIVPAIEVLNKAATGATVLKTIFDITTTPAVLEYDVAFKMSVIDTGPKTIERGTTPISADLKGFLLYPYSVGSDTFIPFVRLEDQDPGGAGTLDLRHDNSDKFYIASNGRAMRFTIPRGFTEKMAGPVAVYVVRGSEKARSANDLEVTSDLKLDDLAPATGLPGATVKLTGVGFLKATLATLKVVFTQSEGIDPTQGPRELTVVPTTATDTEITAVVPMLDDNIAQWVVRAQRGPIGFEARSNGKLFRRGQAGPEGRWIHYYAPILTGDCGPAPTEVLDNIDVFPNGNVRWYKWDSGGYCVRDNKQFHPASGTLVVNGNTATLTRCSEDITKPSIVLAGTWNETSKAYEMPPNDQWTSTKSCLRQVTFEQPINVCIAKEACRVVTLNGSQVRFHCSRTCIGDPSLCPHALGVEADCY
jgi:hypothetical protein